MISFKVFANKLRPSLGQEYFTNVNKEISSCTHPAAKISTLCIDTNLTYRDRYRKYISPDTIIYPKRLCDQNVKHCEHRKEWEFELLFPVHAFLSFTSFFFVAWSIFRGICFNTMAMTRRNAADVSLRYLYLPRDLLSLVLPHFTYQLLHQASSCLSFWLQVEN